MALLIECPGTVISGDGLDGDLPYCSSDWIVRESTTAIVHLTMQDAELLAGGTLALWAVCWGIRRLLFMLLER